MLIANLVASLLQPSVYDSTIVLKGLSYLPDLKPSRSCVLLIVSLHLNIFNHTKQLFTVVILSYYKLESFLSLPKTGQLFHLTIILLVRKIHRCLYLLRYYKLCAADIMQPDIHFLSFHSTFREVKFLLQTTKHASYPLVDAPGTVSVLQPNYLC